MSDANVEVIAQDPPVIEVIVQAPAVVEVALSAPPVVNVEVIAGGGGAGSAGPTGASAYEVAVENGFVGTEAAWLASLVGPAGQTGATGATGATGQAGVGVPAGGTTGQVLQKVDGTDYNTTWATPSGGGGVSGFHYPVVLPVGTYIDASVNALAPATVAGADLRAEWGPFIPARDMTVDAFACEVTTTASSAYASLGIYADNNGVPGDAIIRVTGMPTTSTGQKSASFFAGTPSMGSLTLTAGTVYWLALMTNGGAPTFRALPVGALMPIGLVSTSGSRAVCRRATVSALELPATAPATTLTSASTPQVRLRIA